MKIINELRPALSTTKIWAIHIAILSCLAFIPFATFIDSLTADANIGFFINPSNIISRYASPWDSTTSFGMPTTAKNGFVFPALLVLDAFSQIGMSPNQIQYAWNSLVLLISAVSMYYLSRIIFQRGSSWANFVAALAYMASPFVMYILHGNSFANLPYSVLPLLIALSIKGVRNGGNAMLFAILSAIVLQWASFVNMTYILISIFGMTLFALFELVEKRATLRSFLSYATYFSIITIAVSAWYIVPFFAIQFNDLESSLSGLTEEGPWLYNMNSAYIEVFRLFGHWDFYSGYGGKPYFAYANEYTTPTLLFVASFTIPVLAFVSLIRSQDVTEHRRKLFLALIAGICIPIAAGAYPPDSPEFTGSVYSWLYENISFMQIFRNTLKFTIIIAIAYSLLLGYLVRHPIANARPSVGKYLTNMPKIMIVTGIAGLVVISTLPLFDGRVREEHSRIQVPQYWFDAASWINTQEGEWRVLNTPDQYSPVYEWGSPGDDITYSLIDKSQIYNIPPELPQVKNIFDATAQNASQLSEVYGMHGIRYIIQRNDVPPEIYGVENQEQMQNILSTKEGIEYVRSFGKIDIYENSFYMDRAYAATSLYTTSENLALPLLMQAIEFNKETGLLYNQSDNNLRIPPEIEARIIVLNSSQFQDNSWSFHNPVQGQYQMYLEYDNFVYENNFNLEVNGEIFGPYSSVSEHQYIQRVAQDDAAISVTIRNSLPHAANLTAVAIHAPSGRPWPSTIIPDIPAGGIVQVRFPLIFNGFGKSDLPTEVLQGDKIIVNTEIDYTLLDQVQVVSSQGNLFNIQKPLNNNTTPIKPSGDMLNMGTFTFGEGKNVIEINASNEIFDIVQPKSIILVGKPQSHPTPDISYQVRETDFINAKINSAAPFVFILDESYNKGWKAFLNGQEIENHITVDGYKNGWVILEPQKNADLIIKYEYSDLYLLGNIITIIALLISTSFLIKFKIRVIMKILANIDLRS